MTLAVGDVVEVLVLDQPFVVVVVVVAVIDVVLTSGSVCSVQGTAVSLDVELPFLSRS